MKYKNKQHKEINNKTQYENDLIKLYTQRTEFKDYYSNYGFTFDKKKRKEFKVGTNEENSVRNKSKVKKNNYLGKKNDVNVIHSRNISQVSSFTDKERKRLIGGSTSNYNVRPFSIDDNKEDSEENKKVITTTNNNIQSKPIKKEKIKLLKKLFVNNDNKNKVKDEKEEMKKIFLPQMPVNTKTVIDEKNYFKHKKSNSIQIKQTSCLLKQEINDKKELNNSNIQINVKQNFQKQEKVKTIRFNENIIIKDDNILSISPINKINDNSTKQTELKSPIINSSIKEEVIINDITSTQINNNNKTESNTNFKEEIKPTIRKPQFRIINVQQIEPIEEEPNNLSSNRQNNLCISRKNSSNSSENSEKLNNSTHNSNFFILSPKTPVKRTSLKIVNKSILAKQTSLIKHISSKSLFHTQANSPNINQNKMSISRSKKNSSNNINNFFSCPSKSLTPNNNDFFFTRQKSELPGYLIRKNASNLRLKMNKGAKNKLSNEKYTFSSFLDKMRVRKQNQSLASLIEINDISITHSSSSESSSNSSISQSEAVCLYKDIFKSILDAENTENRFNGINFTSEDIDFNSHEYKCRKKYAIDKGENEIKSEINQLISNRTSSMHVLFDKILVDLKQKNVFHAVAKKLKKELGNFITEFIPFDIEKDENVNYIQEYLFEDYLNKDKVNNTLCIASNKYLERKYFEFNVGMQFQYLQQDEEEKQINQHNNDVPLHTPRHSRKKRKHSSLSTVKFKQIERAYTFTSENVFNVIGENRSLKLRQLDILLLKTSTKINNVLFIDEFVLNDILFWQESSHHQKNKDLKVTITNTNTIKNNSNVSFLIFPNTPEQNSPQTKGEQNITNFNPGEPFQRRQKRGKTRESLPLVPTFLHSKSIINSVKNSFTRRNSTQLRRNKKLNESHNNNHSKLNNKLKEHHVVALKNEGHFNRKKKRKSFSFQSNPGVQKCSIIKKIAYSRNSIQIYNKQRKKQNNKITNSSFQQLQSRHPFFSSENKEITLIQTNLIKNQFLKSINNDTHQLMTFYIKENNYNFVKQIFNTNSTFLNINYEDNFGNTLLCHAVRYASDDVIEFLLINGANPNICNVSILLLTYYNIFI